MTPRLPAFLSRARTKDFAADDRGSIMLIFAAMLVVIGISVGVAVDFGRASTVRASLQGALDSAALAGAKLRERGETSSAKIEAVARAALLANFSALGPGVVLTSFRVSAPTGKTTVSVDASATLPTTFMSLAAIDTLVVKDSASADAGQPNILDFHFLIDASDSMGLAATDDARVKLRAATAGAASQANCEFACHVKEGKEPQTRLELARSLGVRLRMDVALDGIMTFAELALKAEDEGTTTRFSASAFNSKLTKVIDPTDEIEKFEKKLMEVEIGHKMGSSFANTWFDQGVPDFRKLLKLLPLPGKKATKMPYIVLVTDGLQSQYGGKLIDDTIRPFDLSLCNAMKNDGYQVAVVYTKYYPIPSNYWYVANVAPIYDQIESNLRSCASSPDLFAVGDTPGEIQAAFRKIFEAAKSRIRLTS
jgi:Flp pilus assembly protein TadG